jgi:hypothetical protein
MRSRSVLDNTSQSHTHTSSVMAYGPCTTGMLEYFKGQREAWTSEEWVSVYYVHGDHSYFSSELWFDDSSIQISKHQSDRRLRMYERRISGSDHQIAGHHSDSRLRYDLYHHCQRQRLPEGVYDAMMLALWADRMKYVLDDIKHNTPRKADDFSDWRGINLGRQYCFVFEQRHHLCDECERRDMAETDALVDEMEGIDTDTDEDL